MPQGDGYELELKEVTRPVAQAGQVLVRVHAVSLNRRDLLMLNRQYGPGGNSANGIPLSDGAGEVIAVGTGVTRFKVGDRVAGIFFERWIDGKASAAALASARGGNASGMLSEVIVTNADALVQIPDFLSYEEAATLPCAGVTAWVALFKYGDVAPGEFVLLEGTGGVSIFGLQLAAAAGAKPIITSSSDQKLARAKELGAFGTVNYRSNPEWQREVRRLTARRRRRSRARGGRSGHVAESARGARLRRPHGRDRRPIGIRHGRSGGPTHGSLRRFGHRHLRRLA